MKRPVNPAPGTLYHWASSSWLGEDIYLGVEDNQFILIASTMDERHIDQKFLWNRLEDNKNYKRIEKRDLPLFINLKYTGETFKQLLCGEL
jgi:hypothetical protein